MGYLFRTMAHVFKHGAAAATRCSNAVQVEATGDSMEHEHHLTLGLFTYFGRMAEPAALPMIIKPIKYPVYREITSEIS